MNITQVYCMKNLLTELTEEEIGSPHTYRTPWAKVRDGQVQSGPGPAFVQLCDSPLGIGLWVCQRAG